VIDPVNIRISTNEFCGPGSVRTPTQDQSHLWDAGLSAGWPSILGSCKNDVVPDDTMSVRSPLTPPAHPPLADTPLLIGSTRNCGMRQLIKRQSKRGENTTTSQDTEANMWIVYPVSVHPALTVSCKVGGTTATSQCLEFRRLIACSMNRQATPLSNPTGPYFSTYTLNCTSILK
jgi:hypothetical protein